MRGEPDDDEQQTPEELGASVPGEAEAQDVAGDEEPGATDFLKAAAKGAKNLRKLEP
ncbi:MAG: hypothetical protein LC790_07315 [Actinobacteria bacterium]|nr:hypothetical protein [Actinomycetota bacterium]